jgi:hypothetical protein
LPCGYAQKWALKWRSVRPKSVDAQLIHANLMHRRNSGFRTTIGSRRPTALKMGTCDPRLGVDGRNKSGHDGFAVNLAALHCPVLSIARA